MTPKAHDLLRLAPALRLLPPEAPEWTYDALRNAPWVVVRRAAAPPGLIAVGVRGPDRAQRYATTMPSNSARETVSPEDLADAVSVRQVPALDALPAVRAILRGFAWGPTGSVGFELATGIPTATDASDLDVIVRLPHVDSSTLHRLCAIHDRLAQLAVRIDCQVDTQTGAIALGELVSAGTEVLVRTPVGPRLLPRVAALS